MHSRRTHALARTTIEAAVDVRDEAIADCKPTFVDAEHLPDASARRIHLDAEHAIRRAVIEAESAVDARRVQIARRRVGTCEVRVADVAHEVRSGAHSRNRPGFRMPAGSIVCFTRAITPESDVVGPKTTK